MKKHTAIKGFGGDIYFKKEVTAIVQKQKIKTIIETGTYLGDTTLEFSHMVPSVHTIDVNPQFAAIAKLRFANRNNIYQHTGSSPSILADILPNVKGPILFFLDAHWFDYWPILDELAAIAKSRQKNVSIIIHDFYVPGQPLGYDSYLVPAKHPLVRTILSTLDAIIRVPFPKLSEMLFLKQKLDLPYIHEALRKINPTYTYRYNNGKNSTGRKRGLIFIDC